MIATSARKAAALAAAIVTGAAASAFGQQQVANLDEQQRLKAYLKIECPSGGDACEIPAATAFYRAEAVAANKRADEHRQVADTARVENLCAQELVAGARSGDARFPPDRGRALLNGKTPREFGYCNLRDALSKS